MGMLSGEPIAMPTTTASVGNLPSEDLVSLDVAVGDAGAHRECRIDQAIDIDALEIFANECQSSVGAEVVGEFFDNGVGHALLPFRVNDACRLSR